MFDVLAINTRFDPLFGIYVVRLFLLLSIFAALLGCDAQIEKFRSNRVYALALASSRRVPSDLALEDAAEVTEALFGTPDDPKWPSADLVGKKPLAIDVERLSRAAGPVSSAKDGTHQGLFREHCVVCHGLSGGGVGPASLFQNPYPRDFRRGTFKWKSTERAAKPTRDDLRELLHRGVRGTAMPSFALLEADDLEALVDYVVYLSIRGEVERRLIAAAIDELGYEEDRPEDELRLTATGDTEGQEVVVLVVERVLDSWRQAESRVVRPPSWPALSASEQLASIERGKQIFHGQITNCAGCHGPNGNGQMPTLDYDDWTKEYSTLIGLTPSDREAMKPFRRAGAPRPRPIEPRPLRDGVFRGGGDANSLYRRITQGIAGTPMPAVEVVEEANGRGLTVDQVGDLIRYVQSLANVSVENSK